MTSKPTRVSSSLIGFPIHSALCHIEAKSFVNYYCLLFSPVRYFSSFFGIFPPYFPRPMTSPPSVTCDAIHPDTQPYKTNKPKFDYPKTPPYPPTNESVQNLKKWLLDQFATTVGNSRQCPPEYCPPANIHLKDGAIPKSKHKPILVPYHYRKEVKKTIWDDVERGIIIPVPIGAPTYWCSTMYRGVVVIVVGNGHGDTSSNPGRDWLHFT